MAEAAATTRSAAPTSPMPAPAALPCTAATTGRAPSTRSDTAACSGAVTARRCASPSSRCMTNSLRSPPAQKRLPAPVSSTTPRVGARRELLDPSEQRPCERQVDTVRSIRAVERQMRDPVANLEQHRVRHGGGSYCVARTRRASEPWRRTSARAGYPGPQRVSETRKRQSRPGATGGIIWEVDPRGGWGGHPTHPGVGFLVAEAGPLVRAGTSRTPRSVRNGDASARQATGKFR